MKIYEICDEENEMSVGTLLYFEKEKSYIIELQDDLDEWTAPLLLSSFVKKGVYTIPSSISLLWVKERVIPTGRQNINSILETHKLKEYDENSFLEISEGKCSQDMLYIRKINSLPAYVMKRARRNITECTIVEGNQLLCFFADDTVKKADISKWTDLDDINRVVNNQMVFESVKVGTGGYSITFNDSIEVSARLLWDRGKLIPLTPNDFLSFVRRNVLDTSECCEILECSRQNLSYLVKEKSLNPIKENVKGNLYLKGDILRNRW